MGERFWFFAVLLSLLLFAGCAGGSGADASGVGDAGGAGDDGAVVGADGLLAEVPAGDDSSTEDDKAPQPAEGVAFRYETRFGTTKEWKGLTVLSPLGTVHTETAGEAACEKEAKPLFLEQFLNAIAEADPFSWDEDYTGSETGTCPPDAFLQRLYVESLATGKVRDVIWCTGSEDQIPGVAAVTKAIAKLKGDTKTNGICGLTPFVLPKPTPVEVSGYDDGLNHMFGVARYENPDFCLLVYGLYDPGVYRSNHMLQVVDDNVSQLKPHFPVDYTPAWLDKYVAVCPEAAALVEEAAFVEQLTPPAVVFMVVAGSDGTETWVATEGVISLQPASMGEMNNFNLNELELKPLKGLNTVLTLDSNPWQFKWIGSTIFSGGGIDSAQ